MSDFGTGRTETRLTVPWTLRIDRVADPEDVAEHHLGDGATGVFSKLRSKPLPLDENCGRSSETVVTSAPS